MRRLSPELPVAESFDPEYLEYYGILPLEISSDRLRVATVGEPNPEVLDDLERCYGASVDLVPAESGELKDAIDRTFASFESVDALVRSLDGTLAGPDVDVPWQEADERDLANQPPVVRYVTLLLKEAHGARASDVHVESTPTGLQVRYRVDGTLTTAPAPPADLRAAVVSRIKLIADLDIAERRVPQDGRTRLRVADGELDLRVSTIPTLYGESVVLRLLDQGGGPTGLQDLGMDSRTMEGFSALCRRSHGIVLSCGPTGSGKTTTLYAALGLRDAASEKILTVEDPVEYRLPGVAQVPVNVQAEMTFAVGLRALLRQDPDVLMVGEIRDPETARIAIQAAMTGHLVFSTVHTNDAASAVTRLVDLGVEPYMVAATLRGVLAQRLVRTYCQNCARPAPPTPVARSFLSAVPKQMPVADGCDQCHGTGFLGRVGLFELLVMNEDIRAGLGRTPDAAGIRALAVASGMASLRDDGRKKVFAGLTSVEEVLRVTEA